MLSRWFLRRSYSSSSSSSFSSSGFASLGVPRSICDRLKQHYGIQYPTEVQQQLIPSILQGQNVFLRDKPGTGKTFGLAVALSSVSHDSLWVVPNEGLVLQINQWLNTLAPKHSVCVDTPRRLLNQELDPKLIVVDEVDQALRLPKRYATVKQKRVREANPKPTQILLDRLFARPRQAVFASASFNRPLRFWLSNTSGWLTDTPVFIDGQRQDSPVQHHCLLVTDDSIRNLTVKEDDTLEPAEIPLTTFDDLDDRMLDSIATLHEIEKPRQAILILGESVSRDTIAKRLENEYNIESVDLRYQHENPSSSLYIGNEFSARGVDLPNLSHVYILGKPSSVPSYLHMAGRTGRLAPNGTFRPGKVITLVRDHGRTASYMQTVYKHSDVPLQHYPHVQ
ncbi:P-loop containing nucleoside triphosphate hydrolase protein [Syncephalastrum racemosum]|uniref:P-loop containing nucleoside triphosphate hydrolase protein n=1 Tax=Syncephalastrum racemosum TaxID=13706 RepID=A0A1X2H8R0_SYNRA|nr:P-loop containing nucleoside triphosphate hydrolase protein [Syncephalastrum racemosum]